MTVFVRAHICGGELVVVRRDFPNGSGSCYCWVFIEAVSDLVVADSRGCWFIASLGTQICE